MLSFMDNTLLSYQRGPCNGIEAGYGGDTQRAISNLHGPPQPSLLFKPVAEELSLFSKACAPATAYCQPALDPRGERTEERIGV